LVLTFAIVRMSFKHPLIIERGKRTLAMSFEKDKNVIDETELKHFVYDFVSYKYSFTAQTIEERLKKSLHFTNKELRRELKRKMPEEVAFAVNTKMAQSVYPKDFRWEKYNKKEHIAAVEVIGDRIISMNGNRVVTDLKVNFLIEKRPRTKLNPTGLSILFIKEVLTK